MPFEFTQTQAELIARNRNKTNDRTIEKTAAVLFLLLQEIAAEVANRIRRGQYPIPVAGQFSWAQKLLAGQKTDGRSAAILGYRSASELMQNLGRPSPSLSDDGLTAGFLYTAVDSYFEQAAKRQATTFIRKAETAFKSSISAQKEDGSLVNASAASIAAAVLLELKQFNSVYSMMAAQAGMVWANNEGATRLYISVGIVQWKWQTAGDERVCPFCAELQGTIVAVGDAFAQGGTRFPAQKVNAAGDEVTVYLQVPEWNITHPPLHPRCRCVLLPHA